MKPASLPGWAGRSLALSLWLLLGFWVRADDSHTPILFEGRVGPYQARVVVRPPGVVPGLADIAIRILDGEVRTVTVLPIKWNSGKQAAPAPDVARAVPGDPQLYAAELWFMESGAHGIEVSLQGAAGEGRVLVPVNSMATRVLALPRPLGIPLAVMGTILLALIVSIAGAAFREAVLAPGLIPSTRRLWAARGVAVLAAAAVSGLVWGGWNWWQEEASDYRNNRLYRSCPIQLTVLPQGSTHQLRLELEEASATRYPPLVPDHGRLMHLFLVQEPGLQVLAHLHPVRRNRRTFEANLPRVPAGEYTAYAQITLETGFTETLTNRVTLPAPPSEGPAVALDPDDAWQSVPTSERQLGPAGLGAGLRMTRVAAAPIRAGEAVSLRFEVRDGAGQPVPLEPYLGMSGHLVVRDRDGRIFTHVHPSGSFSMAAQQLFELREAGLAPRKVVASALDPTCQLPSVEESTAGWLAQAPAVGLGNVSFPYEFIRPGAYRLWAQVRIAGQIRTGVFDVDVEQ